MMFDPVLSSDPVVADAEAQLQKITNDYQTGALQEAEYRDLVNDILDDKKVEQLVADQTRRIQIFEAYQRLKQIISVITSLPL